MNERIQELELEAYNFANAIALPGNYTDEALSWYRRESFNKKFAELIVRECLVQISNAIPDTDCSASGAYKTAKIAATIRVKEHFGVEE